MAKAKQVAVELRDDGEVAHETLMATAEKLGCEPHELELEFHVDPDTAGRSCVASKRKGE